MFLRVNTCFLIFAILANSVASTVSKIDPELNKFLKQGGRSNVFITFEQGIKPALERTADLRKNSLSDSANRRNGVVAALRSTSDESQKNVVNILSAQSRGTKSFAYFKKFWSSNIVFIKDANYDIIQEIAQDPKVAQIKKEPIASIPETSKAMNTNLLKNLTRNDDEFKRWALTKIQVQEAWTEAGNKGEGIVVATIDTGVRHTHEALRDNFVGSSYGWFDPFEKSNEPYSSDFHGTHTLGTLAGSTGIGVAPGVKWMTCVSCNETYCPGEALLDCMQFLSCPTLPDGSNPDCTKAPRVISNSWVTPHGTTDFNDAVLAWRALGIIPVFAIGNNGVYCRSTKAPGELPWVIGVGSSDPEDTHFYSSSVGPGASGIIKPDIIAPGLQVWSASDSSDTAYRFLTGTSMATPQVAGVVALLLARNPNATYEEIYNLITSTANPNVTLNRGYKEEYCDEGSIYKIPNIYFGYGVINALKALKAQTKLLQNK